MLLHTFAITPNNRKVVAFIKHFDLPVEIHQVNFAKKETQSPEFVAMNPMSKVPLLVDGDFSLWESNAILSYLARSFPYTKTLPTDTQGRANVDRWLHWQSCHLMPQMGRFKTADDTDLSVINPLFDVLEVQLQDNDFVTGELSIADFAIAAYLMTSVGNKLDYSKHPRLAEWRDLVRQLKGFVESEVRMPPKPPKQ
ncbi:MAG: glutathione S-transferase family protein [Gammaproteobacteria bacterium]|nr:glutathione S-transferase family protein [Gammaproteobacteria bacterium]